MADQRGSETVATGCRKLDPTLPIRVFYFATTENKPWLSCNKPVGSEGAPSDFLRLQNVDQTNQLKTYETVNMTWWLSDSDECEWVGVLCNEFNQT